MERMEATLRDEVFALDQQQSDPDRGVRCPKNAGHGRMVAEGTGLMFMCRCGAQVPANHVGAPAARRRLGGA